MTNLKQSTVCASLTVVVGLLSTVLVTPAQANTAYPNPSGYSQCGASDINDSK
jgi:hypothetical protein